MHKEKVLIREIAQLSGVLTAFCNGMEHGKMHYRSLEKLKVSSLRKHSGNFEAEISLDIESRIDCQWGIDNAGKNAKCMDHGNPNIVIVSDASSGGVRKKGGWGAI